MNPQPFQPMIQMQGYPMYPQMTAEQLQQAINTLYSALLDPRSVGPITTMTSAALEKLLQTQCKLAKTMIKERENVTTQNQA